jgi:hypothetical protein
MASSGMTKRSDRIIAHHTGLMCRMLIRTGESDFSTYYKRLGPFAKLATSSVSKATMTQEIVTRIVPRLGPG